MTWSDVLVQRPAAGHIQDLEPSAYGEHGDAFGHGPAGDSQVESILFLVNVVDSLGRGLLAIGGWVEVTAPGEQDSVSPREP